jgi:hypothetical protein
MDDEKKKTKSLDPADIQTERKEGEVSRRSVLGVLGSLAAGGAAATVLPGCFRVRRGAGYDTGVTDSDGGPYADPGGYGRGRVGYVSGVTDRDGGPYADPAGNGRGVVRHGYTGITDRDGGPYADPAGSGRGRWR